MLSFPFGPVLIIPLLQSTFFFNGHLLELLCRGAGETGKKIQLPPNPDDETGQDEKRQAYVQNDKASLGLGPPRFLLSVLPTATFLQLTLIFSCQVTTKRLKLPNNGAILSPYATRCGPSSIIQDCCRKFNFLLHCGSVHFLWRLD